MKIEKDLLSLASEYAVASELCRRNIYSQLTLANRKRTDILVESEKVMLRIQVKGKQIKDWGNIKGIYGKDSLLIFVDFENKLEKDRPDFYILNEAEWKEMLQKTLKDSIAKKEVLITEENIPVWPKQKGYEGTSVTPEMIQEHKERWDKILELCKS